MAGFRDKLWLWGQSPGSHHGAFKLPGENRMTPAEGADYFGIRNCCRVVMGDQPSAPFDTHSADLKGMAQVVWSVVGDCGSKRNDNNGDDLDEVLRQALMYSNITGGVLDDFFRPDGTGRYSVKEIATIKERLNCFPARRLDLWMVLYEIQLGFNIKEYLDLCDVVTFWTWKGNHLNKLDDNLKKFAELTPGKRRMAGCYMWDYGNNRPLTMEQMEHQCSIYLQWLERGDIEGIIICSNCIMDIGLDTVEWTRQWIENADKELVHGGKDSLS